MTRRFITQTDPLAAALKVALEALEGVEEPRMAISGGSAGALVEPLRRSLGERWSHLRLTWADERAVPFASEDSSRGAAYRGGALSEEHPPGRELPLYLDGESLDEAADRASKAFDAEFGGLDLVVLGMGGDGHIASLFPGHEAAGEGTVRTVRKSPKPPSQRLTLSLATLAAATLCIIYAKGEGKRDALEAALRGEEGLPSTALQRLVLVTDIDLHAAQAE